MRDTATDYGDTCQLKVYIRLESLVIVMNIQCTSILMYHCSAHTLRYVLLRMRNRVTIFETICGQSHEGLTGLDVGANMFYR